MILLSQFIFLSFLSITPPKVEDYNYFQWNRTNALSQNGKVDQGDWFEWWYTKAVDPQTNEAIFLVYGVVNPWDEKQTLKGSRSYISLGSFKDRLFMEEVHALSDFQADYERTSVKIASQNQMTATHFEGRLQNGQASWNLELKKDWSFNAMGWGLFKPWISNIFWYPAQASATMSGEMEIKGRKIRFQNAPAYQDRNWGRGFPEWWAWIVSNHFENSPGSSLAIGGGKPKVFQKVFLMGGLCIGFYHGGKEYIFRTTDGDKVKFDIRYGKWQVSAENSQNQRIQISASAKEDQFLLLPFADPKGGIFYDYEALLGRLDLKLEQKRSLMSTRWQTVADLHSEAAGLEFGSSKPQKFDPLSVYSLQ